MSDLKRYDKIKRKIETLERQKDLLKNQIVKKIQKLAGLNKDKELREGKYIATLTYRKETKWKKQAIIFFEKENPRCLRTSIDNVVVSRLEKRGKLNKNKLDKLRIVSWSKPNLYVEQK